MRQARPEISDGETSQCCRVPSGIIVGAMLLAAAALCSIPCARAADGSSIGPRAIVLSLEQLDKVTAGAVFSRIDVSATASGATAFTQVYAMLRSMQGGVLMVGLDPADGSALPSSLGNQQINVTYGSGGAYAAGDQNADCSATVSLMSTDLLVSRISAVKTATLTTAICLCSVWAVSLVR
jgi:hypothetical protein